jgi:branched-chain amino acid transport system substrate-binding protein
MMRRAAALAAVLVAGACNSPLRIGVVIPETGEAAVYGASVKSGVKLAFDRAQAAGTAPRGLEVLYRDSGSDPVRAASAAAALFDAGAVLVIGGVTSAEAKVMIPVADRAERVLISPSASAPELVGRSQFFFRVYPSDELEGVKAADFLTLVRGARTVLVLQEDNDYTRGLLPVFVGELTSHGGRVADSIRLDEAGWHAEVREALARRAPDGVYVCGYGEAILAGVRLLRSLGYRGTICTTSAFSAVPLLTRAASLAEGVFFPLASFDVGSQQEPVRSFVRAYTAIYNLEPDIYAADGYDAALAALAALQGPGAPTGREIARRLHALAGVVGATGPIVFDSDGDIMQRLHDCWIHDGKVTEYDPAAPHGGSRPGGRSGA